MGWWPMKLCVLLNLVVMLGYAMIDAVVAGQILSAVSPDGRLTVEVGIIITAILTWLVTTFGIKIFHHYERCVHVSPLESLLTVQGTHGFLRVSSSFSSPEPPAQNSASILNPLATPQQSPVTDSLSSPSASAQQSPTLPAQPTTSSTATPRSPPAGKSSEQSCSV